VFTIRLKDKPEASWDKMAGQVIESRERWATEAPPVRRMPEKA